jgi:hypothetical protein
VAVALNYEVERRRRLRSLRGSHGQATEAIVPIENEVFGPLIQEMMSLLDTYGDGDLATIQDFLDRAAVVISQSGPGAS